LHPLEATTSFSANFSVMPDTFSGAGAPIEALTSCQPVPASDATEAGGTTALLTQAFNEKAITPTASLKYTEIPFVA
jgi:hypothetical protein